ncbi:hypothetical protein ACQPYA_13770 [Micromonospora sp. CA-263727]|uniref:hypothetical protein n=1 Tax=Micromonospora sp. CA-263727 TaxID=3239967 RepID=UPI003D8F05A9
MTGEAAGPDQPRRWPEAALGVVFFGWMYGGPLLILLGLANRTTTFPDADLAAVHARTTRYFVAGLAVTFGAPVLGLAVALAAGRRRWAVRFGYAIGFALLVGLALAGIQSMARAPLSGQTVEPSPRPPSCVAYSGGTNTCPGG